MQQQTMWQINNETKTQIPIQFKSKIGLREAYSISMAKTQIKISLKLKQQLNNQCYKEQQLATLKIETLKECFIVWLFLAFFFVFFFIFLRFAVGFCIMFSCSHWFRV